MNTEIVFECETFTILIDGDDLILQGLLRDIELPNAYFDLRENVIKSESYEYFDGDGISIDYDTDRVNDIVNESLADYALSLAPSGKTIVHNLN